MFKRQNVNLEEIGVDFSNISNKGERTMSLEKNEGKGIHPKLDIDWFMDAKSATVPTIGINRTGIHLNESAVLEMGLQLGDYISIGFVGNDNLVLVKAKSSGLKLRKGTGTNGSLIVANERLVGWIKNKGISLKRYALTFETSSSLYVAKVQEK